MEKIRILIAATSKDLGQHRQTVIEAAQKLDLIPVFADFEASKNAVSEAYAQIDQVEGYVGLFGNRYGFVPRLNNSVDRSLGELQYRRAVGHGIPMIVCVISDDHPALGATSELEALSDAAAKYRKRAEMFKQELLAAHPGVIRFSSIEDLNEKVTTALDRIKRTIEVLRAAPPIRTETPMMGTPKPSALAAMAESASAPVMVEAKHAPPAPTPAINTPPPPEVIPTKDETISQPLLSLYRTDPQAEGEVPLTVAETAPADAFEDTISKVETTTLETATVVPAPVEPTTTKTASNMPPVIVEVEGDNRPTDPHKFVIEAVESAESTEPTQPISPLPDMKSLLTPMGVHVANSSDTPRPPIPYIAHPYGERAALLGREGALKRLSEWMFAESYPVMVITGGGGIGKTALAWETFQYAVRAEHFAGLIWWRVHETDGGLTNFTRRALAYVNDLSPETVNQISPSDREKQLLAALKKHPHLLVIDGVERWLGAYFRSDAPFMTEFQKLTLDESIHENANRRSIDPSVKLFLGQLALCSPSKVLLASRTVARNLILLPNVQELRLEGLSVADGSALLELLGARGERVLEVVKLLGGNPHLLRLLAGHISADRGGRLDEWISAHAERLNAMGTHERRAALYDLIYRILPDSQRLVLEQLATFRFPVNFAAIHTATPFVPLPPPKLAAPRRWQSDYGELKPIWDEYQQKLRDRENAVNESLPKIVEAIRGLSRRRLARWNDANNRVDIHPMTRGEIYARLSPEHRRTAFARTRLYYERLPQETSIRDFSDLHAALEIYHILIADGQLDAASDHYRAHLGKAMRVQLASPYLTIELLRPLFPNGLTSAPALVSARDQAYFANEMALVLGYIGSTSEALALLGVTLGIFIQEDDAPSLTAALIHYAGLLRDDHKMALKIQVFEMSRDLAEALGDMETLAVAHLFLLKSYVDNGQWEPAEAAYRSFNDIPAQFRSPARQATAERIYAKMLVCQLKDPTTALTLALELANQSKSVAEQRAIYALWGESALQTGRPDAAEQFFRAALDLAPQQGGSTASYLGGLARAQAGQGKADAARASLAKGAATAAAANVFFALGDKGRAKSAALEAYRMAWADGHPYTFWWELQLAKRVLEALGVPEPELPVFDPSTLDKIPHEAGIRAFIDKLRAERSTTPRS